MTESDDDKRTIKLTSQEGKVFEVPLKVAKMSKLVVNTLGDGDEEDHHHNNNNHAPEPAAASAAVPLPIVSSVVLEKILEYCTHYCEVEEMTPIVKPLKSIKLDSTVQEWYVKYVDNMPKATLCEVVAAANFMDITPLLDLTCLAISLEIKGISANELKKIFSDTNDEATTTTTTTVVEAGGQTTTAPAAAAIAE